MHYRKEFTTLLLSIIVIGALGLLITYCPRVEMPGELQPVPSDADIGHAS